MFSTWFRFEWCMIYYVTIKWLPVVLNQLFISRKRQPSTALHPIVRVLHHKVKLFYIVLQLIEWGFVLCIKIACKAWHVGSAGLKRCLHKLGNFTFKKDCAALRVNEAIDTAIGCGLSNEAHREFLPRKTKVMLSCSFNSKWRSTIANKMKCFSCKEGIPFGSETFKRRLANSVTVRISA